MRGAAPSAAGGRHERSSCVSAEPKRAAPGSFAFCKIRKGEKAIPSPFCKFRFPAA